VRAEQEGEASHSAVQVPAMVRGSKVPVEEAGKVPGERVYSSTVQADLTVGSSRRKDRQKTEKYED